MRLKPARANGGNPLESLAGDIARLLDRDMAADMWDRYQRGEGKAFSKRLYTTAGQKSRKRLRDCKSAIACKENPEMGYRNCVRDLED